MSLYQHVFTNLHSISFLTAILSIIIINIRILSLTNLYSIRYYMDSITTSALINSQSLSYLHSHNSILQSSIHLEISCSPFCLLTNSPWPFLLSCILLAVIISGINIYWWKSIQYSYSNLVVFIGLFIIFLVYLHFWFRDILRELVKKYEILLLVLYMVFFLFVLSEALLFVSFFWASFHSSSSPSLSLWPSEGFYIPDPCELTFTNTLLLSNAAVSLGGAFVSIEISLSSFPYYSLTSIILACTFISLQIKEFRIMGLSINDSVYSSIFFFITGLHFFHLLVGLIICCLLF